MKKSLPFLLLVSVVGTCHSQIAQWTFESLTAPGSPGAGVWVTNIAPEVGSGVASAWHVGNAAYTTPSGNGSAKSLSANTWAVGDLFQFVVDTTGQTGIGLSYDQTSSTSGPGRYDLAYSLDGSAFTTFAASYVVKSNAAPNPVWNTTTSSSIYTFSYDLSSVTALDNQPNVWFRIVDSANISAGGGALSATGTDRIDNVTVFSPAPEPSSAMLVVLGLAGGAALRRRRRVRD
jgi:hypothetical protein